MRDRFYQILDTGEEPDLDIETPREVYAGGPATLNRPSFDSKLAELNRQLQTHLHALTWDFEDWHLAWDEDWSLSSAYHTSGKYEFTDSYFRADHAWAEWHDGRLGGRYDKNLYNKMDSDQRWDYEREFKSVYNRVIGPKMAEARNKPNEHARRDGYFYGQDLGQFEAYEAGYKEAFSDNSEEVARNVFEDAWEDAFQAAVESEAVPYLQGPVLEISGISIVDKNGNGLFEGGESLGLSVSKIANLGRRVGTIRITLQSDVIRNTNSIPSFDVAPSTRTEPIYADDLAVVRPDIQTEATHTITVTVGPVRKPITFSLSWDRIVTAFADTAVNEEAYETLRANILSELRTEWVNCMKQGRNWYKKGYKNGTRSKLERLVTVYERLGAAKGQNLRDLYDSIDAIQRADTDSHYWKRGSFKKLNKRLLK